MTVRRQVLEYVKGRLTGLSLTGARVWFESERSSPVTQAECPAIVIVDRGDLRIDPLTLMWPERQERTMGFDVLVLVASRADVAALTSQLETAVEVVLAEDIDVNGAAGVLSSGFRKTGSIPDLSSDGDLYAGRLTISYEAAFMVNANAPDVPA